MSTVRFPSDSLVNKLMRRQDEFWRRLRKRQEQKYATRESDLMPSKPKRLCSHPGCPTFAEAGSKCEEHSRQQSRRYDEQRGSAAERGYDSRWQKYRLRFLAEHPLCRECWNTNKHAVPARHVDHIIPVSGPNDPLFWVPSNHQGLCHSCHSKKTAMENGGFGNG